MAQTSDRVSKLAATYVKVTPDILQKLCADDHLRRSAAADIRTMAASLLRQDEVRGVRAFLRKAFG
jgi:hypothetical protein